MVSASDMGPDLAGAHVVFLGKTINSYKASLHPGV